MKNIRVFWFCSLITLGIISGYLGDARAADLNPLASRTDPVVIVASQLEGVLGADLESLSLWSGTAAGPAQLIPHQIDERFESGDLVLIPANFPHIGRLSPRDELVFMAKDAGYKLSTRDLPRTSRFVKEIEIIDEKAQTKAWVYLVVNAIPQVPLPLAYIQYRPQEYHVIGQNYYLNYLMAVQKPEGIPWLASQLSLQLPPHDPGFQNQRVLTSNLIKGSFLKVEVGALGDWVEWTLPIDDLRAKEIGHKSGPVRALRKIRLRPRLGLGLTLKPVDLVQSFYGHHVETKIQGDIGGVPIGLLSKLKISLGQEFIQYAVDGDTNSYFVKRNLILQKDAPQGEVAGHNLMELKVVSNMNGQELPQTRTYWEILAEGREGKIFSYSVENPDCPECMIINVDAKGLATEPFHFKLLQYFPPTTQVDSQNIETLKTYLQMHAQPLVIRTKTFDQGLVLRLGR